MELKTQYFEGCMNEWYVANQYLMVKIIRQENNQIILNYPVAILSDSEIYLRDGRFKKFNPSVWSTYVSIQRVLLPDYRMFCQVCANIFEWLGANAEHDWFVFMGLTDNKKVSINVLFADQVDATLFQMSLVYE